MANLPLSMTNRVFLGFKKGENKGVEHFSSLLGTFVYPLFFDVGGLTGKGCKRLDYFRDCWNIFYQKDCVANFLFLPLSILNVSLMCYEAHPFSILPIVVCLSVDVC